MITMTMANGDGTRGQGMQQSRSQQSRRNLDQWNNRLWRWSYGSEVVLHWWICLAYYERRRRRRRRRGQQDEAANGNSDGNSDGHDEQWKGAVTRWSAVTRWFVRWLITAARGDTLSNGALECTLWWWWAQSRQNKAGGAHLEKDQPPMDNHTALGICKTNGRQIGVRQEAISCLRRTPEARSTYL